MADSLKVEKSSPNSAVWTKRIQPSSPSSLVSWPAMRHKRPKPPSVTANLFQNGKTQTFRRMLLGVFVNAAQQLSGINMVSTYANQILSTSFDLSPGTSHLIAACGGTEYAICSLLSVFLIEGLGRRRAFMWTASGMAACFIVIPILLSTSSRIQSTRWCWFALPF